MDVSQFARLRDRALVPFLAFVVVLALILSALTLALRWLWQRQVRQLAEVDRQKDELIGIVSHQLHSPVVGVRWALDDLLAGDFGPLPPEQQDHLRQMAAALGDLAELIGLLLDVSRIELGRLPMQPEDLDLQTMFATILPLIEQQARAKRGTLVAPLPATFGRGHLDRRLTHAVLENLLVNAVKYTPPGGRVTLAVERQGGKLHVRVADTGGGIPVVELGHIFGKLFRASNVQQQPGNGFGLDVAKGAVEQQGGTITFHSQEGRGTTFVVRLPLGGA
jgi:signal transduction histidine kinase